MQLFCTEIRNATSSHCLFFVRQSQDDETSDNHRNKRMKFDFSDLSMNFIALFKLNFNVALKET